MPAATARTATPQASAPGRVSGEHPRRRRAALLGAAGGPWYRGWLRRRLRRLLDQRRHHGAQEPERRADQPRAQPGPVGHEGDNAVEDEWDHVADSRDQRDASIAGESYRPPPAAVGPGPLRRDCPGSASPFRHRRGLSVSGVACRGSVPDRTRRAVSLVGELQVASGHFGWNPRSCSPASATDLLAVLNRG